MCPKNAYPQNLDQMHNLDDVYRIARFDKHQQLPPQILSSSTYQDNMPLHSSHSDPGTQQYFGVFVNEDANVGGEPQRKMIRSIETPEFETPTASSNASQSSSKKQRGRPRLDPQDETPAERRRTQIRLAQRAYRNRKETTISELKGQVSDMQRNFDHMSRIFTQLHDNLYDSGVLDQVPANHPIIQQLEQIMDNFAEASRAPGESDRESQERGSQVDVEHAKLAALRLGESDESSTDPEAWPQTIPEVPNALPPRTNIRTDSQPGMVLRPSRSTRRTVSFTAIAEIESQLFALIEHCHRKSPPLQRSINAVVHQTDSSQETTFARRLQRCTLERALDFLINPRTHPGILSRVFRFSSAFTSREKMLDMVKDILARSAGENLENFHIPFLRIGGAGLHFPRRDEHGRAVLPMNSIDPIEALGSIRLLDTRLPRAEIGVREVLEAIGFGGIWFDAHDVEGYLASRGLHLTARNSYVTIEQEVFFEQDRQDRRQLACQYGHDNNNFELSSEFHNSESRSASDNASRVRETITVEAGPGFVAPGRPLVFNVEKFICALAERCVFLGRAPGYCKSYVDRALHLALEEVREVY